MPPGIGYGTNINPQIIMRALQQRGLLPPQQEEPGGIRGFLKTPGLSDALLSTGSALLAQKDQAGSLGGALGRALPLGAQAFKQGQQSAALDEAFAGAPPEMQKLLAALPLAQKAQLAMQMATSGAAEPVALGSGERLVDPSSGEEIVSAIPSAESFTYRDLPDGRIGVLQNGELINTIGEPLPDEPDFADETSLRKEFDTQIGTFDDVAEAYNKVRSSASKDNPTAADDLSLVFGYMKIVDPGSVVREGEQASARNAGGVPDRIRSLYNRLLTEEGAPLTANQRTNFLTAARELVESQVPLYQQRATYYDALARRMGLDPGSVIRNPFLGTDIETGNAFGDLIPRR